MTTLKEDDAQNESSGILLEVNRTIAILNESIKKNGDSLANRKASIHDRKIYARMVDEDKTQLQILENAVSNNQFNTSAVKAVLQRHKNTNNPEEVENSQAIDTNKSSSVLGAFMGIRQKFHDWRKNHASKLSTLDTTVSAALQNAQTKLDKLLIKRKNLDKVFDPSGHNAQRLNNEKQELSQEINIIEIDIRTLSKYKNEDGAKIDQICRVYKTQEPTPQAKNNASQGGQNLTLNQLIDIGLQNARTELDKLSVQRKNLDKILTPTEQLSEKVNDERKKLLEKMQTILADINKLVVYKEDIGIGNEDEINKIYIKYATQIKPQAHQNIRKTNNQNKILDQMVDIGIKGAQAKLEGLRTQSEHLIKIRAPSEIIDEISKKYHLPRATLKHYQCITPKKKKAMKWEMKLKLKKFVFSTTPRKNQLLKPAQNSSLNNSHFYKLI